MIRLLLRAPSFCSDASSRNLQSFPEAPFEGLLSFPAAQNVNSQQNRVPLLTFLLTARSLGTLAKTSNVNSQQNFSPKPPEGVGGSLESMTSISSSRNFIGILFYFVDGFRLSLSDQRLRRQQRASTQFWLC